MSALIAILLALIVASFAIYVVSLLPLPPVPQRLAQAAVGLVCLAALIKHQHWL